MHTLRPPQSVLDVSFLAELTDLKLNVLKLSEEPVEVVGELGWGRAAGLAAGGPVGQPNLSLGTCISALAGYFSPNRYESVPARLTLDVSSLRPATSSRLVRGCSRLCGCCRAGHGRALGGAGRGGASGIEG